MSSEYLSTWTEGYSGFKGKAIACIAPSDSDNCLVGFDDGSYANYNCI